MAEGLAAQSSDLKHDDSVSVDMCSVLQSEQTSKRNKHDSATKSERIVHMKTPAEQRSVVISENNPTTARHEENSSGVTVEEPISIKMELRTLKVTKSNLIPLTQMRLSSNHKHFSWIII
jgi:hypothetical protein